MVGILAVVPEAFRKYLMMTFIVAMAGLDVYSLHYVAIPYYAHSQRLFSSDVFHLVADKPQFIGSGGLTVLWALLLVSIGAAVLTGCGALRRLEEKGDDTSGPFSPFPKSREWLFEGARSFPSRSQTECMEDGFITRRLPK
jgi:hypothetical protein